MRIILRACSETLRTYVLRVSICIHFYMRTELWADKIIFQERNFPEDRSRKKQEESPNVVCERGVSTNLHRMRCLRGKDRLSNAQPVEGSTGCAAKSYRNRNKGNILLLLPPLYFKLHLVRKTRNHFRMEIFKMATICARGGS
jgi:hypothetical protein